MRPSSRTRPAWLDLGEGVAVVPLAAVLATATVVLGWAHRWVSDDGYITLRVADQLAHGNGFVYNVGERIEASTSPLWTLVLGLAAFVTPFPLPWIAVVFGLVCSAAAVWFGVAGSARWAALRPGHTRQGFWPVGALLVLGVPYVWDFTTSGLDIAMALTWLSVCWWWMARVSDGTTFTPTRPLLVFIGIGTLVRPELAIVSVALLVVVLRSERSVRTIVRSLAYVAALPVAYQVFRMGYFAAIVPNTALTKEGSLLRLDGVGLAYVGLFLKATLLPIPVLLLLWPSARRFLLPEATRAQRSVALAFAISGLVLVAYLVLVGGDFMMGRLLLPALLCFALPVFVVPHAPGAARAFAVPLLGWIVVAGIVSPTLIAREGSRGTQRVADERRFYVIDSGNPHPVTYRLDRWSLPGVTALVKELGPTGYVIDESRAPHPGSVPFRPEFAGRPNVRFTYRIGVLGYLLDLDTYMGDASGLADPVISRIKLTDRGRPGHEKIQDFAYFATRFGPDGAHPPADCKKIADIAAAVREPLTVSRFVDNLLHAWDYSRVRFDAAFAHRCAGAAV
jgi:arabinofuranosyltransferase